MHLYILTAESAEQCLSVCTLLHCLQFWQGLIPHFNLLR